jgi:hypothetical protein
MDETTATSEMRVATLNLWGRRGAWEERRRVLAEGFRELAPDLVAFQEAVVGDGYDQVADILGPGYHVVHQTDREAGRGGDIEDGQGISIASRWPLGEVWEPDLNVTPRTDDFACGTLIAEVFAPEPIGPLLFVNHLPNWQLTFEHERELQTVIAARTIEEICEGRDSLHVVLAGDLDATLGRSQRALLARAAVSARPEPLLPRCVGQHPPWSGGAHVRRGEPAGDGRELGLGAGVGEAHRLCDGALQRPRSYPRCQGMPAHLRRTRGRGLGQRPLRRGCRPFGPDLQRTTGALTALRAFIRRAD